MIFVQGAGVETRSASRFLAEFFAKRGVAALIYDKRGAGASTGDWKRSSFEDLAGDVVAAVNYLKTRPEIDPARVGVMGSSQGGWIAPITAARVSGIRFVVVKSAACVTPEEQELARVEAQMRASRNSPNDIEQALTLYRNVIAYARSGEGWDKLSATLETASQQKWYFFARNIPKDWWFFDQVRLTFDHDPIPVLQRIHSPLLVIFGGQDSYGPPVRESLARLVQALGGGGNQAVIQVFPNAGHDLRVEPGKGDAWDFSRFAPGYLESLASWVRLQTEVGGR